MVERYVGEWSQEVLGLPETPEPLRGYFHPDLRPSHLPSESAGQVFYDAYLAAMATAGLGVLPEWQHLDYGTRVSYESAAIALLQRYRSG